MLKAKKIIRELKNIKGCKYFGAYEVSRNIQESKNLEISPFSLIRALQPYEVDFKKLYEVDYNDVIYDDVQGNYELIDLDVKSDNSYNWNSQIVFNFNQIKVIDIYGLEHEYITVKFHKYGDVRGNYTNYMVCNMTLDEFYEVIMESTSVQCEIKYKNKLYIISTDALKEACLFNIDIQACNDYYTECYSDNAYIDIDNLRSKTSIKKGLIEYLKKEGI